MYDWTNMKGKICNDLPSVNANHKSLAVQQTQMPLHSSLQTKCRQFQAIKYKCLNISFPYIKCKVCKLIDYILYTHTQITKPYKIHNTHTSIQFHVCSKCRCRQSHILLGNRKCFTTLNPRLRCNYDRIIVSVFSVLLL